MTMPEFDPNRPPNPITLEFLAACIIGLNGRIDGLNGRMDGIGGQLDGFSGRMDGFSTRMDSLEARVANVEADIRDLRTGQRQLFVALITIGGAVVATLAGGMIAGIFAVLSRMG